MRGAIAITALAMMLAACGDGATPQTSTTTPPPVSGAAGEKPDVKVPEGDPPAELRTRDVKVGDGAEAAAGKTVTVHYVGVAFSNGQQFDASWDRGQPFSFSLGSGQVIKGWDQGVAGMKVGGRRELIIPPDLGYGAQGAPPAIGPNETLIFVVDLLSVA